MPQFTIDLTDALHQDIVQRATKREITPEEYVIKTLRWHMKKIKKTERELEVTKQAHKMVADMMVVEEDEPAADN